MITSRRRRLEEKNARQKIAVGLIGIVGLTVFLAVFGFRLLIAFSLFLERFRGGSTQPVQQANILLAPILDQLPEATNSATIDIRGTGTPKTTAIIYVNGDEYKRILLGEESVFYAHNIPVDEGSVTISARITDTQKTVSDISNTITTVVDRTPPDLTIEKPESGVTINDGTHKVPIAGATEQNARITINDRIAVVHSDGSFTYDMPLNDGENTLKFIATDVAGNSIEIERKVIYQP